MSGPIYLLTPETMAQPSLMYIMNLYGNML